MTTKKAKRKAASDVPATMRDWTGWVVVNDKGVHQSAAFRHGATADAVLQVNNRTGDRIARVRVTEVRTPTRKAKA